MNTGSFSQDAPITVDELKAWLKHKQLPYAWLAHQAGVKESTVQHWMASARNIPKNKQEIIKEIIKRRNHSDLIYDSTDPEILEDIPELKETEKYDNSYCRIYIRKTLMAQLATAAKLENVQILQLINAILTEQGTAIIKRHFTSMTLQEQENAGVCSSIAYGQIVNKLEQITAEIGDIDVAIIQEQNLLYEYKKSEPISSTTAIKIKNCEKTIEDLKALKDAKLEKQKDFKKELETILGSLEQKN